MRHMESATTTHVDMTYSFLSDEEPSDEQLAFLMHEVAEDVRRETADIARIFRETMALEVARHPALALLKKHATALAPTTAIAAAATPVSIPAAPTAPAR
jgi:hypothetical protein